MATEKNPLSLRVIPCSRQDGRNRVSKKLLLVSSPVLTGAL